MKTLKDLGNRESRNGYEVGCFPQYRSSTDWSYILGRYPLDVHNQEPTEILIDFKGQKWPEIIPQIEAYLAGHPDDGFCWW